MIDFYQHENEGPVLKKQNPLVFKPLLQSDSINVALLPTGNIVMEIKPVTLWISHRRNELVDLYVRIKEGIDNYKLRQRNNILQFKDYLNTQIFTDKAEKQQYLVPTSVAALGAFYTGRVLTSKRILDSGRITVPKYLLTSLPSRIIIPLSLMSSTFAMGTPVAWENTARVLLEKINSVPDEEAERALEEQAKQIEEEVVAERVSMFKYVDDLFNVKLPEEISKFRKDIIERFH